MSDAQSQQEVAESFTESALHVEDIPSQFLLDDFRLPSSFFKIQTADEVVARTEDMNKHLENVEQSLTRVLGDNFKQFNQAFESFSLVIHDLL